MLLPKFEHQRPTSLNEASALIQNEGKRALVSAGGTDLIPRMKYGIAACRLLVSLNGIKAKKPRIDENGNLTLDALMTLADLLENPLVSERAPMLVEAAWEVASNQIRHMGTVGGNLCQESRCLYYNQSHAYQFVEPCYKRQGDRCYLIPKGRKCWAVFMSDLATALISLNAEVELVGSENKRRIPLSDMYTGDSLNPLALSKGELVASVYVPSVHHDSGASFIKFATRGGVEFAGVNVAVALETKDEGKTCSQICLTVGAISGGPVRLTEAESLLAGQILSPDAVEQASQEAVSRLNPFPHHGYSSGYLKAVLKEEIHRALTLAIEQAAA